MAIDRSAPETSSGITVFIAIVNLIGYHLNAKCCVRDYAVTSII